MEPRHGFCVDTSYSQHPDLPSLHHQGCYWIKHTHNFNYEDRQHRLSKALPHLFSSVPSTQLPSPLNITHADTCNLQVWFHLFTFTSSLSFFVLLPSEPPLFFLCPFRSSSFYPTPQLFPSPSWGGLFQAVTGGFVRVSHAYAVHNVICDSFSFCFRFILSF